MRQSIAAAPGKFSVWVITEWDPELQEQEGELWMVIAPFPKITIHPPEGMHSLNSFRFVLKLFSFIFYFFINNIKWLLLFYKILYLTKSVSYPLLGILPTLDNLKTVHTQEWLKDPINCYIGRKNIYYGIDSIWGNPYRISQSMNRYTCVDKYKNYLLNNQQLMQRLPELFGKNLGCWCEPELCQGHAIIDIIKEKFLL